MRAGFGAARGERRRGRPDEGNSRQAVAGLPESEEVPLRVLAAKLEERLDEAADILGLILQTQEQMLRRVNENRATLMALLNRLDEEAAGGATGSSRAGFERASDALRLSPSATPGDGASLPDSEVGDYGLMVARVRALVRASLPVEATVLVVSRGDEELLRLDGRAAWHFPRSPGGQYAGHHPADDEAAIRHLAELRAQGAEYLVLPRTAFWWLDHYRGLEAHLRRDCELVVRDDASCVIFRIAPEGEGRQPTSPAP